MTRRNEALRVGISNFLEHHPKERQQINFATHLGVVAIDEVFARHGIKVGTIGTPTIRSISGDKKVNGEVLAGFIQTADTSAANRKQLWIPTDASSKHYFHKYRAEIAVTDEQFMLDGWVAAQSKLEAESDPDEVTELLEEAKNCLISIGAMTIEAGYIVIPPIPEHPSLTGRE